MRERAPARCATEREVGVVAAVLVAGSEKAAAHRLGLSHSTVKHHLANARSKVGAATTAQLVWILAPRLPEPESGVQTEEIAPARLGQSRHNFTRPVWSQRQSPRATLTGFRGGRAGRSGSAWLSSGTSRNRREAMAGPPRLRATRRAQCESADQVKVSGRWTVMSS